MNLASILGLSTGGKVVGGGVWGQVSKVVSNERSVEEALYLLQRSLLYNLFL
jgi:hypothetical protein